MLNELQAIILFIMIDVVVSVMLWILYKNGEDFDTVMFGAYAGFVLNLITVTLFYVFRTL